MLERSINDFFLFVANREGMKDSSFTFHEASGKILNENVQKLPPLSPKSAESYTFWPVLRLILHPILHPELSVKTEGSGRGCRNVGEKHKTFFGGRRKVGVATFESSNLLVFTKGYDLSHHAK